MTVILLRGLGALLLGIYQFLRQVMPIFRFPLYFGTGFVLLLLNVYLVPFKMLEYVPMIKTHYTKLMLFVLIVILVFLYGTFVEKI